ncbi:MAG: efflux RND transporter permease subunit [Alphaproteobacteria bacterium]|nr:efflux RND transporter permease subunit [Alphaproteobacteria bacterium]
MTGLLDAIFNRSRMVVTVLVMILLGGLVAYLDISKEAEPDVDFANVYVSMVHEGISPNDAERLLIRPMEKELKTIEGIKEMKAVAVEGHASVLIQFDPSVDPDKAVNDVREKVDKAKRDLPSETKEPTVTEFSTSSFPVMVVLLSGDLPERALYRLARDLKDRIEGLPSILEARVVGNRAEVLEVEVEPVKLEAYNISNEELLRAVSLNNRLVAAGALDTGRGRFSVKVPGLFETAKDVLGLPIKATRDGTGVVTLGDVTTVRRTFKDATSYARLNGERAVAVEIYKRVGANIIENNTAVRHIVEEARERWPAGVKATYTQDKMKFTLTLFNDLQNSVISAVLLVMVVVVAVLGVRTGLLVGLAIPGSFLFGILCLAAFGMTMNMVVMFSLILSVGMLVDDSIVVTEYADRRMMAGVPPRQAFAEGAQRMAWPIISATFTIIAAFLPLLFWPGIVGKFMVYLPVTLIVTLLGSLLVALMFVPVLGASFGRASTLSPRASANIHAAEHGNLDDVKGYLGVYIRTLRFAIHRPWMVLFATIGLMFVIMNIYGTLGKGTQFFAEVDPDNSRVLVHARGNLSIDEKDALVRQVEERVLGIQGIKTAYTRTGTSGQGNNDSADTIGSIYLEFTDWQTRPRAKDILNKVRERTADIPGVRVEARQPEAGPPTGKGVRIQLSSHDPMALDEAVPKVRALISRVDGLRDIEDSRPLPGIEWRVAVDRAQAGRFGADVTSVGNVVKLVTNGIKVGTYRPDDAEEEIDIMVRFPRAARTVNALDDLRVLTPNGHVPISNFVSRSPQQKTGTIERIDGIRVMRVEADVLDGVLPDTKVKEIRARLPEIGLPAGVNVTFKGKDEEQNEASAFLTKAFAAAIFLITIILVTQFNSFYHSLLILTAVVFSTIGVMLALMVAGLPFSIVMTGIGIITLAGVVVRNNIILIDTYQVLRRDGLDPFEAALRTGAQRVRPVFLTAFTAVIGLAPLVFSVNIEVLTREVTVGAPSTQWWVNLSTSVAGGLAFATILTLIVTPCLLVLGYRTKEIWAWVRSLGGQRTRPASASSLAPAE